MYLAQRARDVVGSLTLAIDARAKAMLADGVDVISFGAGEPDFDTPENIQEAAIRALKEGKTRYTPSSGLPQLKEAVCQKFLSRNRLSYQKENILISNGAKHSLYNVCCAILEEGDEVLLFPPYWVTYPEMVKMAGGVPVSVPSPKGKGYLPRMEDVKQCITPRTRAVVINTPNNPTGSVLPWDFLVALGTCAVERRLTIISDEIYEDFCYDGQSVPSIATVSKEVQDHTVVVNGVSKTYAMTGWRIGYLAAPAELVKVMDNWQSHSTSNPNTIAQWAAIEALSGPQDSVTDMVREFDRRRNVLTKELNQIDGIACALPGGAFYCLPDISLLLNKTHKGKRIQNEEDFASLLLEDKAVATVPGNGFDAPCHIRLSYALSMEHLKEGVKRVAAFVSELE